MVVRYIINYIDSILQRLDSISADDVIQEIGGNVYKENIDRAEVLKYPQFIQDIIFLVDMDTELVMQGDLSNETPLKYIPNMVTALKNIHAYNEADVLQNIYEIYTSFRWKENADNELDEKIDNLYKEMYYKTGFDIWSLLENYVEHEKSKSKPSQES